MTSIKNRYKINFKLLIIGYFSLLLLFFSSLALAQNSSIPFRIIPDGLGVNIHFIDPLPGEMKMLSESGVKWIRIDFVWDSIEKEKGVYDFSAYDRLINTLQAYQIKPLLILDYANKLYDNGKSIHTEEGRSAFAKWAASAVKHFINRGILWEMYNEPNISWVPKQNAEAYVELALAVGKAIREVAPNETFIGPATSGIDLKFLETCFKGGLLEYWSGVTVHPYRPSGPETATAEFEQLRLFIEKYAPKNKAIPILVGEWGYTTTDDGITEERQGKLLSREWLINLMNNIPLSIWYDWRDDGLDPKNREQNFGMAFNAHHPEHNPVFDPKPAYFAAKTLTALLKGFQFEKRLAVGSPEDYILFFKKGDETRLVSWTIGITHNTQVPVSPGNYQVTSFNGESLPSLTANSSGLTINLTDGPVFIFTAKPESPKLKRGQRISSISSR